MSLFSRNPDLPFAGAVPEAAAPAGEASALQEEVIELFDQLRGRMLRYVLGFGLPLADAEEIVQEVFLALFQHLSGGKPRTSLRAWLFQVAHNLSLKR